MQDEEQDRIARASWEGIALGVLVGASVSLTAAAFSQQLGCSWRWLALSAMACGIASTMFLTFIDAISGD